MTTSEQQIAQEHLWYGKVYMDQGDAEHAIDEFMLALKHDPANTSILLELGKACFNRKEFQMSAEYFERALAVAPQYADLHYHLGCAYMEGGQKERAINEFKEALNINPRYTAARNTLGGIMKTIVRGPQPKEETADRAETDHDARQANIHFHLGNALMQKNLMQEALVEFKEAVRLRPNYPDIHNRIGELYMRRGLYNLAEEEFLLCLKINPKYSTSLQNLADTYRMHSEQLLDKAEATYMRLLEIDTENEKARSGLERVRATKNIDFV